jgi:hypothetical protein
MLPRVWYGMTYILIRGAIGSVPYSDEGEVAWSFAQAHMVQEGLWYRDYPGKPYHCYGTVTTLAKPSI